MSASKLSICRPKAFLATLMSRTPSVGCSGRPSMRFASRIMPAHVPNAGIPAAMRPLIAASRPTRCISLIIVVLSPPGSSRASTLAKSSGVRTRRVGTLSPSSSALRCLSKSPCKASRPMVFAVFSMLVLYPKMTGARSQKSEARSQKSEARSQKSEARSQKSEGDGPGDPNDLCPRCGQLGIAQDPEIASELG